MCSSHRDYSPLRYSHCPRRLFLLSDNNLTRRTEDLNSLYRLIICPGSSTLPVSVRWFRGQRFVERVLDRMASTRYSRTTHLPEGQDPKILRTLGLPSLRVSVSFTPPHYVSLPPRYVLPLRPPPSPGPTRPDRTTPCLLPYNSDTHNRTPNSK